MRDVEMIMKQGVAMINEGMSLIAEVFSDMPPSSQIAFARSLQRNQRSKQIANTFNGCSDVQGRLRESNNKARSEDLNKMAMDIESTACVD